VNWGTGQGLSDWIGAQFTYPYTSRLVGPGLTTQPFVIRHWSFVIRLSIIRASNNHKQTTTIV